MFNSIVFERNTGDYYYYRRYFGVKTTFHYLSSPGTEPAISHIQGLRTGGNSVTDYQGPNGGGVSRKPCNKNVVFTMFFFF